MGRQAGTQAARLVARAAARAATHSSGTAGAVYLPPEGCCGHRQPPGSPAGRKGTVAMPPAQLRCSCRRRRQARRRRHCPTLAAAAAAAAAAPTAAQPLAGTAERNRRPGAAGAAGKKPPAAAQWSGTLQGREAMAAGGSCHHDQRGRSSGGQESAACTAGIQARPSTSPCPAWIGLSAGAQENQAASQPSQATPRQAKASQANPSTRHAAPTLTQRIIFLCNVQRRRRQIDRRLASLDAPQEGLAGLIGMLHAVVDSASVHRGELSWLAGWHARQRPGAEGGTATRRPPALPQPLFSGSSQRPLRLGGASTPALPRSLRFLRGSPSIAGVLLGVPLLVQRSSLFLWYRPGSVQCPGSRL